MLVVTGSFVALQSSTSYATEPGTDGLLATSSDYGTTIGNADGTGQHVPTPLKYADYATWSSDGSRVAWQNIAGTASLVVSDPDGAHEVWIPDTTSSQGPTWYDSNTKLVFTDSYQVDTNHYLAQLYVAPVTGTGSKTTLFATDTGCNDRHPLAHGNLIAFTRTCDSSPSQVWLYDKATGTAHEVLDNAFDADISPDGTKIVFSRTVSSGWDDLFESAIDGSGVTQLTTTGDTQSKRHEQPVWSPSGTRIAYYGSGGPYAMDTEIFDLAAKTETVWLAFSWGSPSWQPINPSAPKPPPAYGLNSPGDQISTVGTAVSLKVTTWGSTGLLNWSATGLPAGLFINNASTGVISGTPTTAGTSTVTVTATSGTQSDSVTFS